MPSIKYFFYICFYVYVSNVVISFFCYTMGMCLGKCLSATFSIYRCFMDGLSLFWVDYFFSHVMIIYIIFKRKICMVHLPKIHKVMTKETGTTTGVKFSIFLLPQCFLQLKFQHFSMCVYQFPLLKQDIFLYRKLLAYLGFFVFF